MNNEIVKTLLYTSEDGTVAINVIIDSKNDTIWTTQKPWPNYLVKISKP